MNAPARFFSAWYGPILAGAALGILGPLLAYKGNPANMGICVACFTRDTAGALGLHRAAAVQYIRPELIGLVFGALIAAFAFREFRARTGSSPLARFALGFAAVIGALVFLGCPWRAYLRVSGGDWNAAVGIAGLVAGIGAGILFLKRGFSLGRNRPSSPALGWMIPLLSLGLLALLLWRPELASLDKDGKPAAPAAVFFSKAGPGSQHVPWHIGLGAGLLAGFLAQRSRFCTVGAFRDILLLRDPHLLYGLAALVGCAAVTNAVLGQFHPGFVIQAATETAAAVPQPIAHTNHLWNFGGMVLSGLAFTLAGGCPGRQLILAGEGDADAGVFALGMMAGAATAHNFNLASTPAGPAACGPAAVIAGLALCIFLGLTMRDVRQD